MDYLHLFTHDVPLIDVRAPVEFEAGHFPGSVNLPLLNDEERVQVGTCYKNEGQAAAIALGHSLVNGEIKSKRVQAWLDWIHTHPGAKIYCFRGGLRSNITQQWIAEAGLDVDLVPGGYKELRRFLLLQLAKECESRRFILLGGKTGAGKTPFLYQQALPFVDLEKRANHRGSSFGIRGQQPSQVTFENSVIIDLLKTRGAPFTLIEHESPTIGKLVIPGLLFDRMKESQMIILERPMLERADHIIEEYVLARTRDFSGDVKATHAELALGLERISRKLGGLRYQQIKSTLDLAFQSQDVNTVDPHRSWVIPLIEEYYDPPYLRDLEKRKKQILFQGNESECLHYLEQLKRDQFGT